MKTFALCFAAVLASGSFFAKNVQVSLNAHDTAFAKTASILFALKDQGGAITNGSFTLQEIQAGVRVLSGKVDVTHHEVR